VIREAALEVAPKVAVVTVRELGARPEGKNRAGGQEDGDNPIERAHAASATE
jgi:hypothetical protein